MLRGLLIIISGPSGVGKGTIIQELLRSMPELVFSISATTRPPRENEKDGVHYFFISRIEFEKRIRDNEFLEWAKVHDDYYGTPRKAVETSLNQGKTFLLDVDVQGSLLVKRTFPDGVFIFVVPPTFSELRRRLLKRHTEKKFEIDRRLKDAEEELRHLKEYDYLVTNDVLNDAVLDVRSIIQAERCKQPRRLEEIKDALSPD